METDTRRKSVESVKQSENSLERIKLQRSGKLGKLSNFDSRSLVQAGFRNSGSDMAELQM